MKRIRILQEVRGDWPFGHTHSIQPGIYEPVINPHGAVSVKCPDGALLGIKPNEFEWVGELAVKEEK